MRLLALLPLFLLPVVVASNLDPGDFAHFRPVRGNLTRRAGGCKNGFSAGEGGCVCDSPKLKSVDGSKCSTTCSSSSFPDTDAGQCVSCTEPAIKCTSATVATACRPPFWLYKNACVPSCPSGTWSNPTSSKNVCFDCQDVNAGSCSSGGKKATSCVNGKYLLKGKCIDDTAIPDGMYGDLASHTAKYCDKGVAKCHGAGKGNADACGTDSAGDPYLLTPQGTCSKHCRSRFYADKSIRKCIACADPGALKCDASGALKCGKDSNHQQLFLTPSKNCILPSDMAGPYYPETSDNTFKSCDDGVLSCVGAGEGKALVCGTKSDSTPLFFVARDNLLDRFRGRRQSGGAPKGDCVVANECPDGTFADFSTSTCSACDEGEKACSGKGVGLAIQCKDNYYSSITHDCLNAEQCIASGPYFVDMEHKACVSCAPGVDACTGNGAGMATRCGTLGDQQLYLSSGDCVPSGDCPAAQYPDDGSKQCMPCDAGALTCTGPNAATSCGKSLARDLLYLNTNGRCVLKQDCASGTYSFAPTQVCESCKNLDPDADTCTSPMTLSCRTKYLHKDQCLADCGDGLYGSEAHVCEQCGDSRAKSCTADASTSCKESTDKFWNGACSPTCPSSTYINADTCSPCTDFDDNALTCDEHGIFSCLDPYNVSADKSSCVAPTKCEHYTIEGDDDCYTTCPAEYYTDEVDMKCLPCPDDALTCADGETATSCGNNAVLDGSECHANCPETKVPKDGVCVPCSDVYDNSVTCTEDSAEACVEGYDINDVGDCEQQ